MKTLFPAFGSALLVGGLLLGAVARGAEPDAPQPANEPAAATPAPTASEPDAAPAAHPAETAEAQHPATETPPADAGAPAAEAPATTDPAKPNETRTAGGTNTPTASPGGSGTARPAATPAASGSGDAASAASPMPSTPVVPVKPGEKGLRLNFRNAPLEQILNYLSEAAGFIIVLEARVEGRVDVWSAQPLDQDEAVVLLNSVLNKNGFAAIRNERTLTIINRDDAKKRNTPVVQGGNPDLIPKNDDIVTQIIPLRFINAVQVSKDLATLIPSSANVAANEGGNALLVTDTQANIHRLAQIIKALDTSISSSFSIKVFALQYADAKSLATVIKDVFQTQETSTRNAGNAAQQFFNRFRGGPGGAFGGGGAGGGAGDAANSNNGGRPGASRVVAVSDDRSNSVVVSAPDDVMPSVEGLVKSIDVPVEDVTELRVFRLKYADPLEMADLLSGLFQTSTSSQSGNNNRGGFRFGGGPFGGGGFGNNANNSNASGDRMLKQTQVTAVADQRTRSVVVSASRAMMEQIAPMVAQLDADPARKRKVYVYDVENTDPQAVQDIVETLFPEQNYRNTRTSRSSTQQNSNQLNNRQTQTRNQSRSSSTGFGSSSFGSGFGSTGR